MISKYWKWFSVLLLGLGAVWIWFSAVPDQPNPKLMAPSVGFLAPEFSLSTATGEVFSLADLRGRPVLLNFWASWCPPCRAEMPALQKVYAEYQNQGLLVLAINATAQDDVGQALTFAQNLGLSFPILLDRDGAVMTQYQVNALPTSFFILSDGTIQEIVVGGPMSETLLRVRVEDLLGEEH